MPSNSGDRKGNGREATAGQVTTEPATENRQGKQQRDRNGNREGIGATEKGKRIALALANRNGLPWLLG